MERRDNHNALSNVAPHGSFVVSCVLKDKDTEVRLNSYAVSFTADSPIAINPRTCAPAPPLAPGSGLTVPDSTGIYKIQAHFAGNNLYKPSKSPIKTHTVV